MKASWDVKPLGEVCAFQGGTQPPKSQFVDTPRQGYVRLLQIRDFKSDDRAVYVADNGKVKKCETDDIMIGRYGASVGQIHRGKSGAYNVALVKTIPDDSRLDRDYFYYYLTSDFFQKPLMEKSSRGAQDGFNQGDIAPFPVPLPPLEEQQRIVAVLDEAFEGLARARAHAEANLQNARELFENFLGAIFTRSDTDWISAPLQELVERNCSLSYGIVQPGDDVSGGLPIVRPTDLRRRIITLDGLKRIDPAKADGYARTKLKGTEILLCVRGSTGVVAMASEELDGANVTRGIVPVRFAPEKMDQRLGYYQFLSKPVQDQIKAGTYGAALMKINIRDLRKLTFFVPPVAQQEVLLERIESVANDFDTLIEDYTRKVLDSDDLRQSLLQKAFAGELTR